MVFNQWEAVLCEKHIALRFSIQNIVFSLSRSVVIVVGLLCVFQRHPQGNTFPFVAHSPFEFLLFILRFSVVEIF